MKNYPIIRIADIFEAMNNDEHSKFAHGCNSKRSMAREDGGGGIAALVANWCPEAVKADKMVSGFRLGSISTAIKYTDLGPIQVFNLYTQYNPGLSPTLSLYKNIATSLDVMKNFGDWDNTDSIAMPAIGCGIAGGNINTVLYIIQNTNIPNLYLYLHPNDKSVITDLLLPTMFMARFRDGYGLARVERSVVNSELTFTSVDDFRYNSVRSLKCSMSSNYPRNDLCDYIVDLDYSFQM